MDQMQQPQVPEKKEKNKWVGGVMLAALLSFALGEASSSNIFNGFRLDIAELLFFLIVEALWICSTVFIAIATVNPARRRLGIAGYWMLAVFTSLSATSLVTVWGRTYGEIVMCMTLAFLAILAANVLWAVFATRLMAYRKRVYAFVPAILMLAAIFLVLLAAYVVSQYIDEYNSTYSYPYDYSILTYIRGRIYSFLRLAALFFFSALWMKEEMKDLPAAGQREEVYSAPDYTQPYDQQPYGQPQDYGQQPYGQPQDYGQPPQDPNTYQGNQWQGGDPYNRY